MSARHSIAAATAAAADGGVHPECRQTIADCHSSSPLVSHSSHVHLVAPGWSGRESGAIRKLPGQHKKSGQTFSTPLSAWTAVTPHLPCPAEWTIAGSLPWAGAYLAVCGAALPFDETIHDDRPFANAAPVSTREKAAFTTLRVLTVVLDSKRDQRGTVLMLCDTFGALHRDRGLPAARLAHQTNHHLRVRESRLSTCLSTVFTCRDGDDRRRSGSAHWIFCLQRHYACGGSAAGRRVKGGPSA